MDSGSAAAAAFFWAEFFLIEILTEWNSPPLTKTLMRKRVDDDDGDGDEWKHVLILRHNWSH